MISNARVINMKDNWSCRTAVSVDRRGHWGNPFRIGRDGTRSDVLLAHEALLRETPELLIELWHLRDRPIACWCEPMPCHGWLLCWLANCTWEEQFDWLLGKPYWTPRRLAHRSRLGVPGWRADL